MKRIIERGFALALLIGLVAVGTAAAQTAMLEKAVIASGGGHASNSSTVMDFTMGQPAIGSSTNGQTNGAFGFWNSAFIASLVRGDAGAGSVLAATIAPNPADRQADLELTLASRGNVEITLHDITGRQLSTLFSGEREAGTFRVRLDVTALASGTYYVALNVPGALVQRKLSVVH